MMYSQKFAAAIKCGGKVLREDGENVYLPFGSEFSLLLKNLSSVRAQVDVTIDGQDVLGGRSLIVNANSELELERFISSLTHGNRFKFIERTSQIEEYRGAKIDDGLVRIEWKFEKPNQLLYRTPDWQWNNPGWDRDKWYGSPTTGSPPWKYGDVICGVAQNSVLRGSVTSNSVHMGAPCSATYSATSVPVNEVGITVPGSESAQKFAESYGFQCETQSHVMVFHLIGGTAKAEVKAPVTVKTKPKCTTCGRVNKAGAKFCTNCGTALNIIK